LDSRNFSPQFDHGRFLRNILRETGISPVDGRRQRDFLGHYVSKYDDPPAPPSCVMIEAVSFGTASRVYAHLPKAEKIIIAASFGLPQDRLQSWLHSASYLRNICAHHRRVWNRNFSVAPSVAKSERHHVQKWKLLYNQAVAIQTLLKSISGAGDFGDQLKNLFQEFSDVPICHMGFPPSWREEKLRRNTENAG